jgi:hypothetical protein
MRKQRVRGSLRTIRIGVMLFEIGDDCLNDLLPMRSIESSLLCTDQNR